MRFFAFILLLTTLLGSGWAAWFFFGAPAQEDDPQLAALKHRVAQLEKQADAGDLNAGIDLGWILIKKDSRLPDSARAVALFRKAAAKGVARAQYAMGWANAKGRGVPVDYTQAAEWYRVAATAGGDPDAQFALGELYFHGRGVANDYSRAIDLYRSAAMRGHPVAQYLMGVMYKEGWGVKRDLVEAYKWLFLAAPQTKQIKAHNPQFNPQKEREALMVRLNRTQINMAERRARDLAAGK
ncbi:MAG: tetratricopeptide repeat protein [Rhodospirillales bacterium]